MRYHVYLVLQVGIKVRNIEANSQIEAAKKAADDPEVTSLLEKTFHDCHKDPREDCHVEHLVFDEDATVEALVDEEFDTELARSQWHTLD